jgi:hypothetical protein
MHPSAKNSFMPADAKSSSLFFFFAFFPVSDNKSNMSTLEELSFGIGNHIANYGLKPIIIMNYNYLSKLHRKNQHRNMPKPRLKNPLETTDGKRRKVVFSGVS